MKTVKNETKRETEIEFEYGQNKKSEMPFEEYGIITSFIDALIFELKRCQDQYGV